MKESLDSWAPRLVIQRASPPGGLLEERGWGGGTLTCRTSPTGSHKQYPDLLAQSRARTRVPALCSSAELSSWVSSDQARGSSEQQSVSELNVCHARVHNGPLDAPCLPSASQRLILTAQHLWPGSHRARPQRVFNVNCGQYLQNVRVHIKLWFSGFSRHVGGLAAIVLLDPTVAPPQME